MRTYRAENEDGNWDSYASLEYSSPLDKRRRWALSANASTGFVNSVDLLGKSEADIYEPGKSEVRTFTLGERLNLDYKLGAASKVGVKAGGTWRNVTATPKAAPRRGPTRCPAT